MKKKIFGATLLLSLLIGGTASAQTPAAGSCCGKQKACTEAKAQCCDKQKAECAATPFDGLNLSDKQKAQIQALREECQKESQAARKQKADDRKARKEAKLAKIKSILTPEQYVKFLENGGAQKCCSSKKDGKHGKKGHKGHKGNRGKKAAGDNK